MFKPMLSTVALCALLALSACHRSIPAATIRYESAGAAPGWPTSSAAESSTNVLTRIPTGRSYQSAVSMARGVVGQGGNKSLGGGATNENTYRLDGEKRDNARPSDKPVLSKAPKFEDTPTDRDIHQRAYAEVHTGDVAALSAQVEHIAKAAAGRVHRLHGDTVIILVPGAEFETSWQQVLELGTVLEHSVRADDVTDKLTATGLRISALQSTRARLMQLLATAERETVKLQLLSEIARVTETLETAQAQLRTLASLAEMSSITVRAVALRQPTSQRPAPYDGLSWLSSLSPFNHQMFDGKTRVHVPDVAGLVTLSAKGPYIAQGPDGVVFWTQQLDNNPHGDALFWRTLIASRISTAFANVTEASVGAWRCVAVDEPGRSNGYHWQVCVQTDGPHLLLSQAYFPSPQQHVRYGVRVDGALRYGDDS